MFVSLLLSFPFSFSLSFSLSLFLTFFLSPLSLFLSLFLFIPGDTVPCENAAPTAKCCEKCCCCASPRNLHLTACESVAPATESVPDLAKVLRLPRNPNCAKPPRCHFSGPCAEAARIRRAPNGVETEVADIDADSPKPTERCSWSRILLPGHTPTHAFLRALIIHLICALAICAYAVFSHRPSDLL